MANRIYSKKPIKIGVVGFGALGQFLIDNITANPNLELCFVWNRSVDKLFNSKTPKELILSDLSEFSTYNPNLIVEVAHPSITAEYGVKFLEHADYFVGSPTAFANKEVEMKIREASNHTHGLYIPSGALWGAQDIQKMAERGVLESVKITMRKHPNSFKLTASLLDKLQSSNLSGNSVTLYEGPVRELCSLAPQNVNTMAAASLAGLGLDKTIGCLVADPSLDKHQVIVEVGGKGGFKVTTIRDNPAASGAVTGQATYGSFLSSLLKAYGQGSGIHFC